MQDRTLTLALTSRGFRAMVAAFSATLIVLMMLAIPANAQETTGEETTGMVEKEGVADEAGDATAQAENDNTGAAEKKANTVAKAQSSQSQTVTQRQDSGGQVKAAQTNVQGNAQTANRAEVQLAGKTAQVSNTNEGNNANRIGPISVSNCEELKVSSNATVVLRGDGGASVRIPNSVNDFDISSGGNQLTITGPSGSDLRGTNIGALGAGSREITNATGITCNRDDDGDVASANDLEDLECDELLRRFRKADMAQYGDMARFADVNVSNQIVVCLEQEVVQNTAADEDLPETGGVPLLALAALGVVSVVAGVSVIWGARREE